jgi:hypothetical protein
MDTGLTLIDLADFTGKATTYYGRYVTEALEQASDLFELATALEVLPDPGLNFRLAKRGILAMAEVLYEGQVVRDLRFSPFKTETIGSYNYSLAEAAVLQGIPTGISWFDLAVSRLRVGVSTIGSTKIHVFDRPGDFVTDAGSDEVYLPGPADSNTFRGSPPLRHGWAVGDIGDSYYEDVDGALP